MLDQKCVAQRDHVSSDDDRDGRDRLPQRVSQLRIRGLRQMAHLVPAGAEVGTDAAGHVDVTDDDRALHGTHGISSSAVAPASGPADGVSHRT